MRTFLMLVISLAGLLLNVGSAKAAVISIDATSQGWITQDGISNFGTPSTNHLAGNCIQSSCPGVAYGEFRNYYSFIIPAISEPIKSVELKFNSYLVDTDQSPSLTYSVTSAPSTPTFATLGTGTFYGSGTYTPADSFLTQSITLSSSSFADIFAVDGTSSAFGIGGRVTSPTAFGGGEPNQQIFGNSGAGGRPTLVITTEAPPTASPLALNVNMFLASVANASVEPPSTGRSLGDAINYYRNDVAVAGRNAYMDCLQNDNPPGCDFVELERQYKQGIAGFGADLAIVGVDVNNTLQGKAIGAAAVDTSVWDATLLAKVKSFVDFVDDIKSYLGNGIDLYKSLFSIPSPAPATQRVASNSANEPIIINSVAGKMYWDNDGITSWLLSDLEISVDIAKDYFPNIESGQSFEILDSLYPGSNGFGVFTVNDIVDPPGYNTVSMSFRHVDYFPASVSEPGTTTLILVAVSCLVGIRRFKLAG